MSRGSDEGLNSSIANLLCPSQFLLEVTDESCNRVRIGRWSGSARAVGIRARTRLVEGVQRRGREVLPRGQEQRRHHELYREAREDGQEEVGPVAQVLRGAREARIARAGEGREARGRRAQVAVRCLAAPWYRMSQGVAQDEPEPVEEFLLVASGARCAPDGRCGDATHRRRQPGRV